MRIVIASGTPSRVGRNHEDLERKRQNMGSPSHLERKHGVQRSGSLTVRDTLPPRKSDLHRQLAQRLGKGQPPNAGGFGGYCVIADVVPGSPFWKVRRDTFHEGGTKCAIPQSRRTQRHPPAQEGTTHTFVVVRSCMDHPPAQGGPGFTPITGTLNGGSPSRREDRPWGLSGARYRQGHPPCTGRNQSTVFKGMDDLGITLPG